MITEPGVYTMDADLYHFDPVEAGSLSSSGVRDLMKAPAIFKHNRENKTHSPSFDFGHVAHRLVLGEGAVIEVIPFENWQTKKSRDARDEAYANGKVPILAKDYKTALEMARAVDAHPLASKLFRNGQPEKALFWERDGVWRRALVDWLPHPVDGRRMLVCDYKTTVSADPTGLGKTVHNWGYHQQAAWYLDGIVSLDIDPDPAFLFVFQEKTAPYLVTVAELDESALSWGQELNERAVRIYQRCMETGEWPGYSDEVELIRLPVYAERQYEAQLWEAS